MIGDGLFVRSFCGSFVYVRCVLIDQMTHVILLLGVETEEPLKKNKGNRREKVVHYLKSDTYMYAPLGDTRSFVHFAVKNVASPQKGKAALFPWSSLFLF